MDAAIRRRTEGRRHVQARGASSQTGQSSGEGSRCGVGAATPSYGVPHCRQRSRHSPERTIVLHSRQIRGWRTSWDGMALTS